MREGGKREKKEEEEETRVLLHIKDDEKNIRGDDGVEEDEVAGQIVEKPRQPKNHGQKESAVRNRRKSKRARSHPRKTTREKTSLAFSLPARKRHNASIKRIKLENSSFVHEHRKKKREKKKKKEKR